MRARLAAERDPYLLIGAKKTGGAQCPRFDGMPLILETPDESRWAAEIAELKDLVRELRP